MSAARELWIGYDQRGNHWEVKRYSPALPNLVHFTKHSDRAKLLDHVAEWEGNGWSGRRWVPRRPVVPDEVRLQVEQLLLLGVG